MVSSLKKTTVILAVAVGLSAGISCDFAEAQVTSRNGWFSVDYNRACAPFTIHITETDTFPPETVRQYSFEGNGFFQAFNQGDPVQFTYNNPGTYKLVEVVNQDFTGKTDTLEVTVYLNSQPDFTIYTCEANGVTIKISNDQYEKYRVFYTPSDSFDINKNDVIPSFTYSPGNHQVTVKGLFAGGKDNCGITSKNFITINKLIQASFNSITLTSKNKSTGSVNLEYSLAPGVVYQLQKAEDLPAGFGFLSGISGTTMEIDSIDTENKIQLFRIAAYDACQDKYLFSDTLATATVSIIAENNQNRIEWKTFPVGFGTYDLYRDNRLFLEFSNPNISYYVDKQVKCFNTYCYSMITVNRNGHKSISDTACIEAYSIYFPPPVKNTTVSAADKGYELSWFPPDNVDINEFFVQRIIDNDVYSTFDTTVTAAAIDTSVDNTTGSFCYSVSYLDQCKNRSNVGYTACSMRLQIDKDNHLVWNKYSGWTSGVKKYTIEIYDELGNLQREVDVGAQTGYLPDDFYKHQINSYRIRAVSNDSQPLTAYSNYITKTLEAVINVPNAFTPDGDGLNDTFKPVGTELKSFSMKVFTQRGNMIFETQNQNNGWDGSYRGEPVPQDTYIFDIIAEDYQGKSYRLKGALDLLRH